MFLWIVSLVMSVSLFCKAHKIKMERAFLIAEAGVWLLLFLVLPFVLSKGNDLLTSAVEIFLMGIFLLLLAWQYTALVLKCNIEVTAKYTGYREIRGHRGACTYKPEFEYRYQGTNYKEYSIRNYSRKDFDKMFQLHKQYIICINPNYPHMCMDKRIRVDGGIIFVHVIGILFTLLGIVCFITAI